MVKATRVASDIDRDLRSVQSIVDEVPGYLDEWEGLTAGDQESWAAEWEYAMIGLIPLLQAEFRSGAMTPEQQRVFEVILEAVCPLIPSLSLRDLAIPPR